MSAAVPELTAVVGAIERARKDQPELWRRLVESHAWRVYTDGSAPIKNPGGAIGFSAVFVIDQKDAWEVFGGTPGRTTDPATSNNRAEISGVLSILQVLHTLKTEGGDLPQTVVAVCDSQYVVNCARGKWKKHKNKDLWRRFDQLMCVARQHKVKVMFEWTRAHVGTKWNERADVLAKDGAFLAIGKKPSEPSPEPPAERTPDCHYMLQLYSEMTGKTGARGTYRLASPTRERRGTVELDDVITLDEAEYLVLLRGLNDLMDTLKSADRPTDQFRLLVDSSRDLMLKQIQGQYGVKSARLQPLHRKATQAARKFGGVLWQKSKKSELKEALKDW